LMLKMFKLTLVSFLLSFATSYKLITPENLDLSSRPKEGKFRAAVYEHELVVPTACLSTVCTREEAIVLMEVNLRILEEQIIDAARQGAQFILLPEDGIHGYGHSSREALRPFLEYVQPKADGQVPCEEGIDDGYISSRLSCLAIENNIYIGANFGTVVPGCEYCNHGGECYYNTNVVFSSNGSIVGVYHKYNLWTTELTKYDIDSSPQPQLVTVDTEFGVLGLSVCEDLLWKSPTVDLVTEKGIDTLLLPLAWWDMFPHQLAHSNEDAWARGLQVNVLSANILDAAGWNSGSGIYSSNGHLVYNHDLSQQSSGVLMIADLDIKPKKRSVNWSQYATENNDNFPASEDMFQEVVYDDLYNFVPLTNSSNSAKVCTDDGAFCCIAEYQADFNQQTVFSLGVFRGDHFKDGSIAGRWNLEMCTVMKCDPKDPFHTCTQDMNLDYTYLSQSDTVFTQLKLSGTFTDGAGVYPEVLFNNVSLQPDLVNISEDGVLSLTENIQITETLVSMSLFGRFYQEDPPYPDQFCPEILKSK